METPLIPDPEPGREPAGRPTRFPLGSILRGLRRIGRPRSLKTLVFVSYGTFDSNSAGHIAGFAKELSKRGYVIAVCTRDPISPVHAQGPTPLGTFTLQDLARDPAGVIGFDGDFQPRRSAMLCWTPRKASRRAVVKVRRKYPIPYLVHLEDNEDYLTGLREAAQGHDARADLVERRALMAGAMGATVINERLLEGIPAGLPAMLLEPGVDFAGLGTPLAPNRRAAILSAAGVPADATVIVYPGNIHRANLEEMAELYRAIRMLRQRGRDLVLVKTGKDDVPVADHLGFTPQEAGVIELGLVERPFLIDLMKCADLFVQPGAPGPFNDYRLPSKLPEFLAVGRPVVLPATNLGLRLRPGQDAMLLSTGTAEEIAGQVEAILDDPHLAARLSANAQAFARQTFRWERQGARLAGFLERLWRARP